VSPPLAFDPGERTPVSRSRLSPLRFLAPTTHPTRGIHFPTLRCSSGSRRAPGAASRHGVPPPLRSVSAVSHDPDGFPLLGSCGLFHPHTPLGFLLPVPHGMFLAAWVLRPIRRSSGFRGLATASSDVGGGHPARGSRSIGRRRGAEAPSAHPFSAPSTEVAVPDPARRLRPRASNRHPLVRRRAFAE